MILYFDTSALVPLVVAEPSTQTCSELWDGADRIVGTRLVYIEAIAALAQAHRLGRVSELQLHAAQSRIASLWSAIEVVELDGDLMTLAATMATRHGLRGYDATHCAAAVAVNDAQLVAVSGDAVLLGAWSAEGVAVSDVNS